MHVQHHRAMLARCHIYVCVGIAVQLVRETTYLCVKREPFDVDRAMRFRHAEQWPPGTCTVTGDFYDVGFR